MAHKLMWAVLLGGVMLIAAPFAIGFPDKADGGQNMIDAFGPIMDQDNVVITATYYYEVFVPLGDVVPTMTQENIDKFNGYLDGFTALGVDAENMVPALAAAMQMPEENVQAFMGEQFPAMTGMLQTLPAMQTDFTALLGLMGDNVVIFEQVPAGLDHYELLGTSIQAEVSNYDRVASLPAFRMFTWFFVTPGVVLVGLAVTALLLDRRKNDDDADVTPEVIGERTPELV